MNASSTAQRFLHSAGAATLSMGLRVGLTFGVELFLRRWVPKEDWGLFSWALAAFLVLGALRDLGLVYHVVRVKPRPYGNLLAVELGWGSILTALTFLSAPWLSRLYQDPDPRKVAVIQALALFLFLEGLSSVPRVFFESELRIGRTVVPEILRNLTFAVVSLSLAWAGFGVWSLVAAQIGAAAVYAALLWWRARDQIPLVWQRGSTWRLLRDSLPLASIWLLAILIVQIDLLILGTLVSGAEIGSYSFSYRVAFLASIILVPAMTRSLYPALVAFAEDIHQGLEAYRLTTLFVSSIEVPAALFLYVNAELVIRILGGARWPDAPGYLRILCFAPLIEPLSRLGGEVLKAYRKDAIWIASSLLTLLSFTGAGVFLTLGYGPKGMAWANYLPLGVALMGWTLHRLDSTAFNHLLRDLGFVYLIPVFPFALVYWMAQGNLVLRFTLSIAASAAVFAVYWRRFGRALRDFVGGRTTGAAESA